MGWRKTKNWVVVDPKDTRFALTEVGPNRYFFHHLYLVGHGFSSLQPKVFVYMQAAFKAAKKFDPKASSWMVLTLNEYIDQVKTDLRPTPRGK